MAADQATIPLAKRMAARATENRHSTAAYIIFLELLKCVNLPFSDHFNAKYDLPVFHTILNSMCRFSTFVTPAVASLDRHAFPDGHVPTARWFMGIIAAVDCKTMLAGVERMLAKSVQMMAKRGMIPRSAVVAMDMTEHGYSGKKIDEIAHGGRSKNGTSWFETYATAAIVSLPYLPHIAIRAVHSGDLPHVCVGDLLRKLSGYGVTVGLLLVDRGFYSAAVMELLARLKIDFIMPVPMNPAIRRAIAEFKAGKRKEVSRYKLNAKGGKGRRPWEYTMVIIKRFEIKDGRRQAVYLVFATNRSMRKAMATLSQIPSEYKKRWAIETGYRTVKETRARTKSNSLSARILFFYATIVYLNVLAIVNYDADTERTRKGLRDRSRTAGDKRAAARARGRGKKPRRWQRGWRNVVTRAGMFDWLFIISCKLLRCSSRQERADFLARLAAT